MQNNSNVNHEVVFPSIHELNHQSDQDVNFIFDRISQQSKNNPTKLFLLFTDQVAICISNMKLFYKETEIYIKRNYSFKEMLEANSIKKHDLTKYYKNCKMSAKMIQILADIEKKYDFEEKSMEIHSLLQLVLNDREKWSKTMYSMCLKFFKDNQFESQTITISKLKQMNTYEINERDLINLLDMPIETVQLQVWNVIKKSSISEDASDQIIVPSLVNWDLEETESWSNVQLELKNGIREFLYERLERKKNGFSDIYFYIIFLQSYKNQNLNNAREQIFNWTSQIIKDLTNSNFMNDVEKINEMNIKLVTTDSTVEFFTSKYGSFDQLLSNKKSLLTRKNSINTSNKLSALMLEDTRPESSLARPMIPPPPPPKHSSMDLKPVLLKSKVSTDLKYVIPPIPSAPKLPVSDGKTDSVYLKRRPPPPPINYQALQQDKYALPDLPKQVEDKNSVRYDNLNDIFKNIEPVVNDRKLSQSLSNQDFTENPQKNKVQYPELDSVDKAKSLEPSSKLSNWKIFNRPSSSKVDLLDENYHLDHHAKLETGLVNLGNSCYLNTVVQCLLSYGNLTDVIIYKNALIKKQVNYESKFGSKGDVINKYIELLEMIYKQTKMNTLKKNGKPISPMNFKISCGLKNGCFNNFKQQDAQEFLQFLLDILHEDLNNCDSTLKRLPALTEEQEELRENLPMRLAAAIEWENFFTYNMSIIAKNFMGQYASRLQCLVCKKTSTTYQTFSVLSLPIPVLNKAKADNISIYDCFLNFLKLETLTPSDFWKCSHCKKKQPSTKKIIITRFPRNLIIHFKRFDNTLRKSNVLITYPNKLDLNYFYYDNDKNNYQVDEWPEDLPNRDKELMLQTDKAFQYELKAVAKHQGTLTGGHYTSIVKKNDGNWKLFDDEKIKKVSGESGYINKDAYMLFYSLKIKE
ncbi:hypothetical protein FOG50_03027 [Hanseniaspora uvarum]|nr:hypothetical protein FOG50_03027 [Hanseniaspora uvarum]